MSILSSYGSALSEGVDLHTRCDTPYRTFVGTSLLDADSGKLYTLLARHPGSTLETRDSTAAAQPHI
jgi:hypothetical protein